MIKPKIVFNCEECGERINWLQATKDQKDRHICMECYNKLKDKKKPQKEESKTEVLKVKIANPILLGFEIAIGFLLFSFVVFLIVFFVGMGFIGSLLSGDTNQEQTSSLEEFKASLEELKENKDIGIYSKIEKCAKTCAGESYNIPSVKDEFFYACYEIYYNSGEEELDKYIAEC